ncbi:hypothetical protein N0V88_002575 [Collariella sp. IMI 366227]|nr:hypothetical protein N0V88_002575 [Collariella sp. IMI 366227]
MHFTSKLILFLAAAATGVLASPAVDAREVATSQTVTDGDIVYVGLDESALERRADGAEIEKRCTGAYLPAHASCTPGKCQCLGNYGCWSCRGGRMQCQPGPGSGVCWT